MSNKITKTYQSLKHPLLALTVPLKSGQRAPLQFILKPKGHGELTTDDPEVQAHIERLDAFRIGDIRVKWSPLQKAEARLAAAQAAEIQAVQERKDAEQERKDAEAELAALKKSAPAPAPTKS